MGKVKITLIIVGTTYAALRGWRWLDRSFGHHEPTDGKGVPVESRTLHDRGMQYPEPKSRHPHELSRARLMAQLDADRRRSTRETD